MSPPPIAEHDREIAIIGGMHRYHLVHHHGAKRMPFYVPKSELAKVSICSPVQTLAAKSVAACC